jgi:DNA-binding response OmpR family regulator
MRQAMESEGSCQPAAPARVLVSEDDDQMRTFLALALRHEGYDVTTCADGVALVDHIGAVLASRETAFGLVISDIRMPGLSGLEFLQGTLAWKGLPPVILITAFGDEETHARARRLGARAVIDKPFATEELLARVREILPPRRTTTGD